MRLMFVQVSLDLAPLRFGSLDLLIGGWHVRARPILDT